MCDTVTQREPKHKNLPSFPSLKAVLEFVLNKLICVGETKYALLKMEVWAMQALRSLTTTTSCQINHMKATSLLEQRGSQTFDQ